MANIQQYSQEVETAIEEALETLNAVSEVVYPVRENVDRVRRFLENEGMDYARCGSFIWQAAFLECRKRGLLEPHPPKKTAAEIHAELESKDRRDGGVGNAAHRRDASRSSQEEKQQATSWLQNQMEPLMDPAASYRKRQIEAASSAKAVANEQAALLENLPVDIDVLQMPREQRRQFMKMDADHIRKWNRRRQQWLAANPPKETE